MQAVDQPLQQRLWNTLSHALEEENRLHNLLRANRPELPNYDPDLKLRWRSAVTATIVAARALRAASDSALSDERARD